MDDSIAIGLFLGIFVFAPLICWLAGLLNPMGYLGVPPWRVPECTCDGPRDFRHDGGCPRGRDLAERR